MDIQSLRQRFPLPSLLTFEDFNGLTRMQVHTPQATATIYLQGAHLTAWQPAGAEPVIFISRQSDYALGKPIRGGIPVVFPWFATDSKKDRMTDDKGTHPGPSHGFPRIQDWDLKAVRHTGSDLHLNFELGPTDISRSMGFDHFQLAIEFIIGPTFAMRTTVTNTGDKPLPFENAFHSYYHVTDVHEAILNGLETTPYIDKTDNFKLKPAANAPFTPTQKTDRIYNNTAATCILHDGVHRRRITIRKTSSHSTVVFNPWEKMPDLGDWEWHEFLAVETANVGADAITLAPGAAHTMQLDVSVEKE